MNGNQPNADEGYMPLCHVCGKPMKMNGIRAKALKLGLRLPNDEEQYVIQCCGHELTIDDPAMAEAAFRNLKKYHDRADE